MKYVFKHYNEFGQLIDSFSSNNPEDAAIEFRHALLLAVTERDIVARAAKGIPTNAMVNNDTFRLERVYETPGKRIYSGTDHCVFSSDDLQQRDQDRIPSQAT